MRSVDPSLYLYDERTHPSPTGADRKRRVEKSEGSRGLEGGLNPSCVLMYSPNFVISAGSGMQRAMDLRAHSAPGTHALAAGSGGRLAARERAPSQRLIARYRRALRMAAADRVAHGSSLARKGWLTRTSRGRYETVLADTGGWALPNPWAALGTSGLRYYVGFQSAAYERGLTPDRPGAVQAGGPARHQPSQGVGGDTDLVGLPALIYPCRYRAGRVARISDQARAAGEDPHRRCRTAGADRRCPRTRARPRSSVPRP